MVSVSGWAHSAQCGQGSSFLGQDRVPVWTYHTLLPPPSVTDFWVVSTDECQEQWFRSAWTWVFLTSGHAPQNGIARHMGMIFKPLKLPGCLPQQRNHSAFPPRAYGFRFLHVFPIPAAVAFLVVATLVWTKQHLTMVLPCISVVCPGRVRLQRPLGPHPGHVAVPKGPSVESLLSLHSCENLLEFQALSPHSSWSPGPDSGTGRDRAAGEGQVGSGGRRTGGALCEETDPEDAQVRDSSRSGWPMASCPVCSVQRGWVRGQGRCVLVAIMRHLLTSCEQPRGF